MTTGKGRGSRTSLLRVSLQNACDVIRPVALRGGTIDEPQPQHACSDVGQTVARSVFLGSRAVRYSNEFPANRKMFDVPDSFFGIPAHPLAIGLGVNESSMLRTLVVARKLIARGWAQQVAWCDEHGNSLSHEMGTATHFSLVGAIKTAGNGELVSHYVIKLVRKVLGEWDLHRWNDNPVRTRAQVLALLDECIERCGGRTPRRGGWAVGRVH